MYSDGGMREIRNECRSCKWLLGDQKKEWILVISYTYHTDFLCQLNVLFYYLLHSKFSLEKWNKTI